MILFVALISICLSGCSRYPEYEEINHKIIFIHQYTNWADGFLNFGYYIDKEGNKTEFDLSMEDEKYSRIENLLPYLEKMNPKESPNVLSSEEMKQYYEWLCKINSKYTMEEKCVADDYGDVILYGIRYLESKDEPEIIVIHKQGDCIQVNTDEYAEKLSDVDELIEKWDLESFGYSMEEKRFVE